MVLFLPLLLLIASCAAPVPPPTKLGIEVSYWVDPALESLSGAAESGFDMLRFFGVKTRRVVERDQAQLRVTAKSGCGTELATSYSCGDIRICTAKKQDKITFAHEGLHELGVWQHVTNGRAVMDTSASSDSWTKYDVAAWEGRQTKWSIFDPSCQVSK